MTFQEFHTEMSKLMTRFDKKYYPAEVLELIWREVRELEITWLKKTAALFMAQHKPALLPEFREQARLEKERLRFSHGDGRATLADKPPHQTRFNQNQITFLFEVTRRVTMRRFPNQNQFVEIFTTTLNDVIEKKDKIRAHNLFKEVSNIYEIPYDDDGPDAS